MTRGKKDILYVAHEFEQDDGVSWQFHCGDDDYGPEVLQLVRLDEILKLDPGIRFIARLPIGHVARRATRSSEWKIAKAES